MTRSTTRNSRRGVGEQGSAMLVVATMLVALLAGGGIAVFMQLQSTKSTAITKSSRSSLYCAEAGLAMTKGVFTNQSATWTALLDDDPDNDPKWYDPVHGITGDIDADGTIDFEVTIKDNDDNTATNAVDEVFLISKCVQNPEVPRTVQMLINVSASGHNYRNQSGGGAGNTGNQN